jgi:hypothetical protein
MPDSTSADENDEMYTITYVPHSISHGRLMMYSDPHNLLPKEDDIPTGRSEPSSSPLTSTQDTKRTGIAESSQTIRSIGVSDLDILSKM